MDRSTFDNACQVLRQYGFAVSGEGALVRHDGGFSGADVWRVATSAGPCCLKRWPTESPGVERIRWVHTLLRHAHSTGCRFVPLPLRTEAGATVVELSGRYWELTNWLDGRADDAPLLSEVRLTSAARAVAQFHVSLSSEPWAAVAPAVSPGVVDRLERLDRGLADGFHDVRTAVMTFDWIGLAARRDEYLGLFGRAATLVRPQLAEAATRTLRLQPCIRDLRREHLLFSADSLTGVVDYGAVQMDHPAIDTARLLGECAGDDELRRHVALASYRTAVGQRFSDAADTTLVAAFDRSNVLLSPGNWLRWILVERREFVDRAAVLRRFDVLMARLRRLVETG